MDRKHIILSVLLVLPFLGFQMSPLVGSWITSIAIWISFLILLVIYNWQFIKQIRIQKPFILASQRAVIDSEKTSRVKKSRPRLIHDGVLWEDGGNNPWGNLSIIGPLCPKDYTPLAIENHDGRIEANMDYDKRIWTSGYNHMLVCTECNAKYTLGKKPKQVRNSRNEVYNHFEGKRRREQ